MLKDLVDDLAAILRRFRLLCLSPEAGRGAVRGFEQDYRRGGEASTEGLAAGLRWLQTLDLRDRMARVDVPVVLHHGSSDEIVPVQSAEWLKDVLPNAKLVRIEGTGHAPFLTRPRELGEALLNV